MTHAIRFDGYEVDLPAGQLYKRGVKINLGDKCFQVLAALLEHPGEVVTRVELRHRLWHGEVFVDFDNNLNTVVARLREVLNDSSDHPRYIETLPKHGYRFLGKVPEPPRPSSEVPMHRVKLVVLPFGNLSGDPAQEYFSDAMTDEIITEFATLAPDQLGVIARTTSMRYKWNPKDVAHIGQELGVDYVVEGGVRRAVDEVAVNVQLIQASDETHLFARKFSAAPQDIFKLQQCIAQTIGEHIPAIAYRVRAETAGVESNANNPKGDLAAYNEYIQGRYFSEYHQARHLIDKAAIEGFARAKEHLENAIRCDSQCADAYDALAELYWYRGYFGLMSPREAFSAGMVHARRALEIDNRRAETHALLGQFHKIAEYNWEEVHREMATALRFGTNSPLVRMRYAVSELMPHGQLEEAVAELERALAFDPLSLLVRFWLGIMLLLWRRYERAFEEGHKLLDIDPNSYGAYFVIAACHRYQKKFEDSIAAQRKAVELSGGAAGMLGWLGLTLAGNGQVAEARDVLQQLGSMAAQGYVPPTSFAWIHLGLRELDAAFQWLNRAVDECDQFMMPIKTYGFFDPIRADPRFAVLLRKMNLEP